ncbi:MAG: hypothetical protein ACRCZP_04985, partial [Phycicoccus sp.]
VCRHLALAAPEPARISPRMTPAHPPPERTAPESREETLAILSDSEALRRLARGEVELARGDGESEEQLAEVMAEQRGRGA